LLEDVPDDHSDGFLVVSNLRQENRQKGTSFIFRDVVIGLLQNGQKMLNQFKTLYVNRGIVIAESQGGVFEQQVSGRLNPLNSSQK
jgi:hypothetical protein